MQGIVHCSERVQNSKKAAMATYNILFDGYWLEKNKGVIPHICGVYAVYRCVHNVAANNVDLKELIYIGQASDVSERINTHDKLNDFNSTLGKGETLCYSCAQVEKKELDIVENALIIAQSPRLNVRVENGIDFSDCQFLVSGQCALLKYTNFTVTQNK